MTLIPLRTDASRDTRCSRALNTQRPRVNAKRASITTYEWAELWPERMKVLVHVLNHAHWLRACSCCYCLSEGPGWILKCRLSNVNTVLWFREQTLNITEMSRLLMKCMPYIYLRKNKLPMKAFDDNIPIRNEWRFYLTKLEKGLMIQMREWTQGHRIKKMTGNCNIICFQRHLYSRIKKVIM